MQRIACFIPVWIILASDNMQKIAGSKGEEVVVLLWVLDTIIVKGSNDLEI
jgi:hypothetical protein